MKAITAEGLTKLYGKYLAVDHINFDVDEGEVFGFLGPNGAGKTTTIKMLNTLTRISAGRATIGGYDLSTRRNEVRRIIGLVPQDLTLDRDMTGMENLRIQAKLYDVPDRVAKEKIQELLKLVELDVVAGREVGTYSWGMQKRLELVMGLVNTPKVLFLDEPTLGLDAQSRASIWNYIMSLNRDSKVTIFLTTHYLEEADELCNRIAIINHGKIIAEGTPDQLKSKLGDEVVTIRLTKPCKEVGAAAALMAVPGVTGVEEEGHVCRVQTPDSESTVAKMVVALTNLGVAIESLNVSKASLNQVFMKTIGSGTNPDEAEDEYKSLMRERLLKERT